MFSSNLIYVIKIYFYEAFYFLFQSSILLRFVVVLQKIWVKMEYLFESSLEVVGMARICSRVY